MSRNWTAVLTGKQAYLSRKEGTKHALRFTTSQRKLLHLLSCVYSSDLLSPQHLVSRHVMPTRTLLPTLRYSLSHKPRPHVKLTTSSLARLPDTSRPAFNLLPNNRSAAPQSQPSSLAMCTFGTCITPCTELDPFSAFPQNLKQGEASN